jgi:hypothetical protein
MTHVSNYYEDVLGVNPAVKTKPFAEATTTEEKEARFATDQLTDRLMVKEMGSGIRAVEIRFDEPIMVTQRLDEGLLTLQNFSNPSGAEKDYYPDGAFGYTQVVPMALNFGRPLMLESVYLKQHRAPNFYLKNAVGLFNVKGFLENKLVLNATIQAGNLQWKQYLPADILVLDRLVIPPGMDMDNLILQVDMNSEEYLIKEQKKRKHAQAYMYEKAYNVRKGAGADKSTIYSVQNGASAGGKDSSRNNFKKDSGYTLTTTPVFHNPTMEASAPDAVLSESFGAKELLEKLGVKADNLKTVDLEDLDDPSINKLRDVLSQVVENGAVNVEGIKVLVNLPKEWMKRVDQLPTKELREAEVVLTRQNFLVHFVFDSMTFMEQRDVLKGQLYHEHYFETILESLKSKVADERADFSDVQSRIVQAMYFFHVENEWLTPIAKGMMDYYK